jgi:hypothetical protein
VKKITSVDDALAYVSRLGFGERPGHAGWIPEHQRRVSIAADALLQASGQTSWYQKTFKPFKAEFHRYKSPEGHVFPWRSAFLVVNEDGKVMTLEMSRVKL